MEIIDLVTDSTLWLKYIRKRIDPFPDLYKVMTIRLYRIQLKVEVQL